MVDLSVLNVVVRNRDGILYQGDCQSVTSFNKVGKFDILGSHANFITLIEKEVIIKTTEGEDKRLVVNNGVCKVQENNVAIFLGIKQSLQTSDGRVQ